MIQSQPIPGATAPAATDRRAIPLLSRVPLSLVMLVALAQGLLFLFLSPPWQHYDEPTHFEYAWLLVHMDRRPVVGDGDPLMRREVAASMAEHNFYWNLAPPDFLQDERMLGIGIPEMVHPPAYYYFVGLPLRVASHLDMESQLYLARAMSLLLFLLTVLIGAGIVRELTPPLHPLRWAVPLTLTLIAPFVNQMTAVNNDAGAVFVVSLFLWGAVRMIRHGIRLGNLLWIVGAAALAVVTKTTAAIVLLFIPVVILLAWWVQRRWNWLWLLLLMALLGGGTVATVLSWGDAAYWYRTDLTDPQPQASRRDLPDAPVGGSALTLRSAHEGNNPGLFAPTPAASVRDLAGETITLGGWVWADRPIEVSAPALVVAPGVRPGLDVMTEPLALTTRPTFVSYTYTVPAETARLYYALYAQARPPSQPPAELYLSGAFIVRGALEFASPPRLEAGQVIVGGESYPNLVRNPSGQELWPRVRPEVERLLLRYGRRSPTFVLASLFDIGESGPVMWRVLLPNLLWEQFSTFGWGHVQLPEAGWTRLVVILMAGATLGLVVWLLRSRHRHPPYLEPALILLLLVTLVIWINAVIWPFGYQTALRLLPAGRYVFPAMIPLALLLTAGWWALWPRRLRGAGLLLFFALLIALNVGGAQTIAIFYDSVAAGDLATRSAEIRK